MWELYSTCKKKYNHSKIGISSIKMCTNILLHIKCHSKSSMPFLSSWRVVDQFTAQHCMSPSVDIILECLAILSAFIFFDSIILVCSDFLCHLMLVYYIVQWNFAMWKMYLSSVLVMLSIVKNVSYSFIWWLWHYMWYLHSKNDW